MLDLVGTHDVEPGDVEEIEVLIGKTQKAILHSDAPTTGLEAKFSIQFAMACAIAERKVTLAELVDPVVQRADLQALMKRVKVTLLTDYDKVMPQYSPWDQVKVRIKAGELLESEKVERARGHIARPVSEQDLAAKFSSCLDYAASDLDRHGLFEAFNTIERQPAGWLARLVAAQGKAETVPA